MTRIDELHKKYPGIPKDVIVKWEILNTGIRDSDDLDKVSKWVNRGPFAVYQTYDHDLTLKDIMEQKPHRFKPGLMLRPPGYFYGRSGFGARIELDTKSPYQIRDIGSGRFGLFEGEDKVDVDIFFPPEKSPEAPKQEAVTSKGTPAKDLISLQRRCFVLSPVRYCEYFSTGEQCKFCNFNGTQGQLTAIGINESTTINLDETIEAYKIFGSDVKLIEGKLIMGGFTNSEKEAKIFLNFIERLSSALPYKPFLMTLAEALGRKDYQRLKDVGLDGTSLQLETWDPELWPQILPGKAKHMSRERWLEAFQDALDVFGVGHVSGKTLGGLTMIPDNGHKTWQEARDSSIEGITWMIEQGIFAPFGVLRMAPGSVWSETPDTMRKRLPPTEYYLEVAQAHHKAMEEYGLYDKVNKLMYCSLCCTPVYYIGDVGIIERAGDAGKWMDGYVPEDANWMTKFLASINSTPEPAGKSQ